MLTQVSVVQLKHFYNEMLVNAAKICSEWHKIWCLLGTVENCWCKLFYMHVNYGLAELKNTVWNRYFRNRTVSYKVFLEF